MDLKEAYQQILRVLRHPEFLDRLVELIEKERHVLQAEMKHHHEYWNLSRLPEFSLLSIDTEIIGRKRALFTHFEEYDTIPFFL